ncbi:MAG: ParB/Srx family N-terminal domain-containing protein [Paraclostridium sp.]
MKITKVKIEEIKQYKFNSKLHPEWQIEQIKKSIKQFGFNDPLAIDENNIIIEGHGRFQALKELGYKEIEVIKLDHLTEQEKKAYIIAHNKININTGFDLDILKKELSDITEFELDLTGFTDFEIEDMMDEGESDILELDDYEEEDEGNSKKLNGLVCPDCGARHKVNAFLECEVDG